MPFQVECCGYPEPVDPEVCLAHACTRTNKCSFTAELIASVFATQQERGERLSTTALLAKCMRQEHLVRNETYVMAPGDKWAAFRGTMYHGQLERFAQPDTVEEARYYVELPELGELTGSPDLVDVKHGVLYDYKNTEKPPRYGKPWDNHIEQNNINRWLVDNAYQVEYGKQLRYSGGEKMWHDTVGAIEGGTSYLYDLTVPQIRKLFVPVDWQQLVVVYMDGTGPMSLPCMKSIQVPKKDGNGTKAHRVPDIWDDDYAEAFIRERYIIAHEALVERKLPAVPPGFEGQSHKLCAYCPKRARCRELEVQELLAAPTIERTAA